MSSSLTSSSSSVQTLVIGAGVVGLSIARLLGMYGREVLIVDKESRVGCGSSSRNSGVVHAGLYYPKGSVKGATCIEGNWMLHRFCDIYKVPINRCGKLVVAKDKSEDVKLQMMYTKAVGMGARDLALISGDDARNFFEPNLSKKIVGAIWSPHTAVIDTGVYCDALLQSGMEGGGLVGFGANHQVVSITHIGGGPRRGFSVGFSNGTSIDCDELINAAGLHAVEISKMLSIVDSPKVEFARGCYLRLSNGSPPFNRLIYPTRTSGHLGIHYTIGVDNASCRFGPDNEWVANPNSTAFPSDDQVSKFRNAIADYWDEVPEVGLVPDTCGIRPRIVGNSDFVIDQHGISGYVALYGIDSPGLTSSLSLAHRVSDLLSSSGALLGSSQRIRQPPETRSQHVYEWE